MVVGRQVCLRYGKTREESCVKCAISEREEGLGRQADRVACGGEEEGKAMVTEIGETNEHRN